QAPLAGGGDTPDLVAAVAEAGALWVIGAAYLTPPQNAAAARAGRGPTAPALRLNPLSPPPPPAPLTDPPPAPRRPAPLYAWRRPRSRRRPAAPSTTSSGRRSRAEHRFSASRSACFRRAHAMR